MLELPLPLLFDTRRPTLLPGFLVDARFPDIVDLEHGFDLLPAQARQLVHGNRLDQFYQIVTQRFTPEGIASYRCSSSRVADTIPGKEAAMIELTDVQRHELTKPEPVAIDPVTQATYVLVRQEAYRRLKALLTGDAVLAMVTGNTTLVGKEDTHFLIDPTTPEGAGSGLAHTSAVKCANLMTVPQSDILQVVGHLSDVLTQRLNDCLKAALEITGSSPGQRRCVSAPRTTTDGHAHGLTWAKLWPLSTETHAQGKAGVMARGADGTARSAFSMRLSPAADC